MWVLIFCGIALAGLAMLACYAVWLARKAADVAREMEVLGRLAEQLGDLAAQVGVPAAARPYGVVTSAAGDDQT
jgi:hypothetical protein